MNIYITADTHYGHTNIAGEKVSSWKSGYRNFDSVEQMNQTIVDNINKVVKEDDWLFHLGNWSFGGVKNIKLFRDQVHCRKIELIYGNHDDNIIYNKERVQELFKSVGYYQYVNIGSNGFALFHYAMRIWDRSHHGSIQLYGHSHGSLPNYGLAESALLALAGGDRKVRLYKSMDIGIDTHKEFRPYHIDEILEIMKDRVPTGIDHHNKEVH